MSAVQRHLPFTRVIGVASGKVAFSAPDYVITNFALLECWPIAGQEDELVVAVSAADHGLLIW